MEAKNYHNDWIDRRMNQFSVEWKSSGICSFPEKGLSGVNPYGDCLICYVVTGSGRMECMGRKWSVHAGNAVLIPMGAVSRFETEDACEILYFQFAVHGEEGDSFFVLADELRFLDVGPRVMDMADWYRAQETAKAAKLRLWLYSDLSMLSADESRSMERERAAYSALTRMALEKIHAEPSIRMTVSGIAGQLKVSPSTLRKHFQVDTGIPMGAYLDTQVYRHAASLLLSTDMQVGEISDQLGFCDQFYFCRFFKRFEGLTPTRYRQRARRWDRI